MESQQFKYPLLYELIYKYSPIPVNIIILTNLVPLFLNLRGKNIFTCIVLTMVFYFINSYYIYIVKIVPYKIRMEGEKLVCSSFFLSTKVYEIDCKTITAIKGGIFDGGFSRLYRISASNVQHQIGFFAKINNCKELQNYILQNISIDVYSEIIKELGIIKGNTVDKGITKKAEE